MDLKRKEHQCLFQQMQQSQSELRTLFEGIKGATENLKCIFGTLQQKESETELLRQKYYDMLAKNAYNEKDRDAYFQLEQAARDDKDIYVHESQKLTHRCSMYLVHSWHHSRKRDNFFSKLLQDVDNYYLDCESMKKERSELITECGNLQEELKKCCLRITEYEESERILRAENSTYQAVCDQRDKEHQELQLTIRDLSREKAALILAITDLKKANNILTTDLCQSKTHSSKLDEKLTLSQIHVTTMIGDLNCRTILLNKSDKRIALLTAKIESMEKDSKGLIERNKILSRDLSITKKQLFKMKTERDVFEEEKKKAIFEGLKIKENSEKMKKSKDEMEKKSKFVKHERELVGKEKDKLVSEAYKIKRRNQELADDRKNLTKAIDQLREKYRRADERANKDLSLKQELKDTIKRLHREIEEEKRKNNKPIRHAGIQTDPKLACDSKDIAIQHAQYKMKQALKARDQLTLENCRMNEDLDRAMKTLEKNIQELNKLKVELNSANESLFQMKEKLKQAEKLFDSTKALLNKERVQGHVKMKDLVKQHEMEIQEILAKEEKPAQEIKNAQCQTEDNSHFDFENDTSLLNLTQSSQQKMENMKAQLSQRTEDLELCRFNVVRLHNVIKQQKIQNETLQRKILFFEKKVQKDRNYVLAMQSMMASYGVKDTMTGVKNTNVL